MQVFQHSFGYTSTFHSKPMPHQWQTKPCTCLQHNNRSHRIFQGYTTKLPTSLSCIVSINQRFSAMETSCGALVRYQNENNSFWIITVQHTEHELRNFASHLLVQCKEHCIANQRAISPHSEPVNGLQWFSSGVDNTIQITTHLSKNGHCFQICIQSFCCQCVWEL